MFHRLCIKMGLATERQRANVLLTGLATWKIIGLSGLLERSKLRSAQRCAPEAGVVGERAARVR